MTEDQLSMFGVSASSKRPKDTPSWCADVGSVLLMENRFQPGSFLRVDSGEGTCECDEFDESGRCKHLDALPRLLMKHGSMLYLFKSALHKAVRRGDVVEALRWARWFANADSPSGPKAYAKNILLEETRNLKLLLEFQSLAGKTYEEVVRKVTASRKKWEVVARKDAFYSYAEGFRRAFARKREKVSPDEVMDIVTTSNEPEQLLEMFWLQRLHEDDELKVHLRDFFQEGVAERAVAYGGWARRLIEERVYLGDFYIPKILLEMFVGRWDETGNEIRETVNLEMPKEELPMVPYMRDYVFDPHTQRGRALVAKGWPELKPGKPQPAEIDMRWSGCLVGVGWRHFAAIQFPDDYAERRWEEVTISKEMWENLMVPMNMVLSPQLASRVRRIHGYF